MGRVVHDALIVTGHDDTSIIDERADKFEKNNDKGIREILMPVYKAHQKARSLFTQISPSPITHGASNGSCSFFIPSSGSKCGWDTKQTHEQELNEYINWLEEQMTYGDGSSPLDWVFVKYGETRQRNDRVARSKNL